MPEQERHIFGQTEKLSKFSQFTVKLVCSFLTCLICDVIGRQDEGPVATS